MNLSLLYQQILKNLKMQISFKRKLSDDNIQAILLLLENGFSFKDTLEVLKDILPENHYHTMHNGLMEGIEINQLFKSLLSKTYLNYFSLFNSFLPLEECFRLMVEMKEEKKKQQIILLKNCMYPILLLLGMLLGVYLLQIYLIPTMQGLMQAFGDMNDILGYINIIHWIYRIMGIIVIISLIIVVIWMIPKYQWYLYCKLFKYFPHSFIFIYYGCQMMNLYYRCMEKGMGTKEIISMFTKKDRNIIHHKLFNELETILKNGEDILDGLVKLPIDENIVLFFHLAIHTTTPEKIIKSYVLLTNAKVETKIKYYAKIIQLISYGCIGVIVIIIYQILLIPMNFTQNFQF